MEMSLLLAYVLTHMATAIPAHEIHHGRSVTMPGNQTALQLMNPVFRIVPRVWCCLVSGFSRWVFRLSGGLSLLIFGLFKGQGFVVAVDYHAVLGHGVAVIVGGHLRH